MDRKGESLLMLLRNPRLYSLIHQLKLIVHGPEVFPEHGGIHLLR